MNECLLCNAVTGKRPVDRLIETSRTLGCLNRLSPVSRGHSVFFPKRHVPTLHEMDDADIADIAAAIKKIACAAKIADYTVLQNNGALGGQTIWHVHFHLVPAWSEIERLHVEREARTAVDHGDFAEKVRAAKPAGVLPQREEYPYGV